VYGINQMRTPNIAMIIDIEHNPTSLEKAAASGVAALGIGITPIARVSSRDAHDAGRADVRRLRKVRLS